MISIYQLKPKFQRLIMPIVKRLVARKITPNQVTIFAVILSIVTSMILMVYHHFTYIFIIIPFVMCLRMTLNAIDGMLAKETNMMTPLGNILNELGDVISDAFLLMPFALLPNFYPPLIIAIVVFSIISEMAGVLGIVIGASRRYDGPMGKSDRAFVFSILAIFAAFGYLSSLGITIILMIILGLVIINIVIRVQRALREVC